jgi:hypothetical protein
LWAILDFAGKREKGQPERLSPEKILAADAAVRETATTKDP